MYVSPVSGSLGSAGIVHVGVAGIPSGEEKKGDGGGGGGDSGRQHYQATIRRVEKREKTRASSARNAFPTTEVSTHKERHFLRGGYITFE